MWARNNSGSLEIINIDPTGKWADTDVNPFVEVPVEIRAFVNSTYKVEDGKVVPPSIDALKAQVKANAAAARYFRETGGLTLPNGTKIKTDRESQAQLASVYSSLKSGLIADTSWKLADGTWAPVTLAQIEPIVAAVAQYVRSCFDAEKDHNELIDSLDTVEELYAYDVNADWPSNGAAPTTDAAV